MFPDLKSCTWLSVIVLDPCSTHASVWLQLNYDSAAFLQVMDVRWYAVHCVAMMNQLVSLSRLAKAAYYLSESILACYCNTHHVCDFGDAKSCNVLHVAIRVSIYCLRFYTLKNISYVLFLHVSKAWLVCRMIPANSSSCCKC